MIVKKDYPTKYFCRGAGGTKEKSDKWLVLDNMSYIPAEIKEQVSNDYEKIFGDGINGKRQKANDFLLNLANEFYGTPADELSVNGCYGQLIDNVKSKIDKKTYTDSGVKKKPKVKGRKTIIGFIDGEY